MSKALFFLLLLPACGFGQTRGTSVGNSDFSPNTAPSVTLPAWNVLAGGTVVGCARYAATPTTTISVKDTGSTNSFSVTNYASGGGITRVAMFKAENTLAVAGDVLTISFSAPASYTAEAAVQYSGTAALAYDTGAAASNTGATVTAGPLTTTQGPEMAVACGSYADTTVTPGTIGTAPMSIAAADSPRKILAIEDASLYQIQTAVTASMNSGAAQQWGFIVGTFKSSNPQSPPVVTEAFSNGAGTVAGVPYIYAGSSATVSFTITNANTSAANSLSGIVFSDTLPAGMTVASPSNAASSCTGGTLEAKPGSNTISVFGIALAATASCTVSMNVNSDFVGTAVNTTGNVSAAETLNGGAATASLLVYGTPAINMSNISVRAVDHSSVNLIYSLSGPGYCQLQFGLASGNYIYSGGSGSSYLNGCQVSIGGLAPNTTYYVMPTARPDANDSIGLCQGGGSCGAVEQSFTTLPLPATHPAPPAAPGVWTPTEPDTSGYTVISMQVNPADGTCVAAAAVAPQAHWSSAVAAGDSLQTVLNKIWFDTVVEFPEGVSCAVNQTEPYFHTGVLMPMYSPAGGVSDWVVIRTHANAASDLPPFGVRTGPQFASKLATLVAQVPGTPISPGNGTQNFNGQIFDCYSIGCNHFWIENLAMTHAFNTALYPPGIADPPAFVNYVRFVPLCTYSSLGLSCPVDSAATTPSYIVLDRIYAYGQPWPSREEGCFVAGGNHWALINNYCTANHWVEASYPRADPTSAGPVVTIPNSTFQFNAFDNNPIGMTTAAGYAGTSASSLNIATGPVTLTTQAGLSWVTGSLVEILNTGSTGNYMIGTVGSYTGATMTVNVATAAGYGTFSAWTLVSPAVATFTAPASYNGAVYAWIGSAGLTLDYQTGAGVSVSCNGCTAISEASPSRVSVPVTSLYYFNGHFANGSFVLDQSTPGAVNPSLLSGFRPIGIYWYPGQYGVYDNNYIQAIGQTVYNDAYGNFEDISWTHNYFYFPRSKMQNSGQWDGYGYSFRNVLESKGQTRGAYIGNIVDGSASYQNPGNAIFLAGAYAGPNSTGDQDIRISYNVFKHLSAGFQSAGGGTNGPPDAPPAARYEISNNLWLDLNRDLYNNGGGGLNSGAFAIYPMGSDINFSNNTIGLTKGSGPALILIGGASASLTTVMGEGLLYSNNVVLTSLGGLDPILSIDGGQNAAFSSFPANPVVAPSLLNGPPGTWKRYLDSDFIHTGAVIAPNWTLRNNVIIGAQNNRGLAAGVWADLTPAQISSSIQQLWPSDDRTTVFPCSGADARCSGSTLAARLKAVGWSPALDLTGGNPNPYAIVSSPYNSGTLGANVLLVNQATGVVDNIAVSFGPTSIALTYDAPDSKPCSADISPDGSNWTRMTDGGGAFSRSLTFTGLNSATPYRYRLMCYFDQTAAYEFLPRQITSGTVATAAPNGGNRGIAVGTPNVALEFTLPAGAVRAVFSFTGGDGTVVNRICSGSPCSVSLSAGVWTRRLTFENSGSEPVGTLSVSAIAIP